MYGDTYDFVNGVVIDVFAGRKDTDWFDCHYLKDGDVSSDVLSGIERHYVDEIRFA